MKSAVLTLLIAGTACAAPPLTGFPFAEEALSYRVSGPGGVPLGDVHTTAKRGSPGWAFEFKVDAGIPGFAVHDVYSSKINSDFCTAAFTRDFEHAGHKRLEEETVDRSLELATRATIRGGIGTGGKSDFPVPDCIKDGLAMLFYARQELGQGRVPNPQQMLFGGLYQLTLSYAGAATITVAGSPVVTDELKCVVKGPASTVNFEMYFARDAARTPLLVNVPFPVGSFSMELVR